jgi:hypothetical protein
MRRVAIENISRVMPLKNMLMPASVPTTQIAFEGHVLEINPARTSVTIPSKSSHPVPGAGRSSSQSTNSKTPWRNR